MKKAFLIPLLITIVLILSVIIMRIPDHFYRKALNEGISSSYLTLKKLPEKFYRGQRYIFTKVPNVISDRDSFWENLHFDNFIVPFPKRHPQFWISPFIEEEAGQHNFGFIVRDFNLKILNLVIFKKYEKFNLNLYSHKVFHFPLFEKDITSKGLKQIWKDLFRRDILLSSKLKSQNWKNYLSPWNLELKEKIYDLYLIYRREQLFPQSIKSIQWWEERDLGIIGYEDEKQVLESLKTYTSETINFLEKDQIYKIELKSLKGNLSAEKFRQRFLNKINYKKSDEDSSISVYASYQALPFGEKSTPNGLIYLYSAFSHNKKSKEFLRQIIQFMERGKNKRVYLDPLYRYGFKLFGSSFSNFIRKRRESAEERLKRKIEEEKKKELEVLDNINILDEKESFKSEEEKIKTYLQRAKDLGGGKKEGPDLIID